jgi:hypothetical protein
MYGDLEEYRTDEYPDRVIYIKDKIVYMELNSENGDLWVDLDTIWTDLKTIFSLKAHEIQSIITKWVEETYNLKGVTPDDVELCEFVWWKRLIN